MPPVAVRVRDLLSTVVAALVILGISLGFVSCQRPAASVTLNVGDQRGSIHSLLQAAGELDHVPYKINWVTFPVGAPLIEAMTAGAVDFGYVGSSTMTFGLVSGSPLKAISAWRFRGPGSGILVRGDGPIRTPADLRGKKIAVVRGSPAHLLVARALADAHIPNSAATYVFLLPSDAKAALASGAVDAWAIWDPYMAIGEQQDHDRVIATSEKVAPEVEDGVASAQAVATKRAQLLDFLARVQRAEAWAEAHPEAYAKVYAAETGVPLDIARIVKGRMHVEVQPKITDDIVATHQKGADLYAQIGVIPRHIDIAAVYDRSFVLP